MEQAVDWERRSCANTVKASTRSGLTMRSSISEIWNNSAAPLDGLKFDVLINSAAQTNVDRCETHRDEAFLLNAEAPRVLAEICSAQRAKLIHISTDYVFDGNKREPYPKTIAAEPISVYGESKREGERRVLDEHDRHLVVRVSWVFGPDRPSFIDNMLKQAREKEEIAAVADKFSTPTYTGDIAAVLPPLFADPAAVGILHYANARRMQLAGVRAMGAGLLPLVRRSDAGNKGRSAQPRRYEKFYRETACSFRPGYAKI